jgi:asparagine synthase (glutamine-hydrolysing)
MCGIAGIINFSNESPDPKILERMRDSMSHRGPDDEGLWLEKGVGLAHRRLSIIDLSSAGHQPFFSDDGNLVTVFNGEIYNFKELQVDLEKSGYNFRTKSDTEVLIKYFQYAGHKCLEKFNGIFAFAVWNRQKQELFIARDRVGVKPFYYSVDDSRFCFASEPKALITACVGSDINESGLDEFLAYRFISGQNTIFKKIKRLLPGHYAVISPNKPMIISRWWHLGEKILNHPEIRKPDDWFRGIFHDSIRYRMVSDAPVGVLLSAGLDSSSVTMELKNSGYQNIQTFNVGFRHKVHDESVLAEKFCSEIGFDFNKTFVDKEFLQDLVEKTSYFLDEPLVHLNDPHLFAISKMAKEKVSVLLSGEGADELLGGYVRYRTFQYRPIWPFLRPAIRVIRYFSDNQRFDKLFSYLRINNEGMMQIMNASNSYPDELVQKCKLYGLNLFPEYRLKVLQEAKLVYPSNPLRQLLYLDQHTYLQSLNDRNDRATMGASIECREPFMDYRLMEGAGKLPDNLLFHGRKNKYILASTIGSQLPLYIQNFRKIGFSVPWDEYLVHDDYMRNNLMQLESSDIFKMGILGGMNIPQLRDEFYKSGQHRSLMIQLVFIKIWYDTYFKSIKQL